MGQAIGGAVGGTHGASVGGAIGNAVGGTGATAGGSSVFGMPTDMKTFFGGSFFSQLATEDVLEKLQDSMPQVDYLDDEAVLQQFAQVFDVDKDRLLAEIETREHVNKDQIAQAVRYLV
mmetsp:Transcript_970/g.1325  ORF Transcript_970/g.1325 Transcript_970/m.1325 type:complete len:119 (+) Transcript_970:355-711(+)